MRIIAVEGTPEEVARLEELTDFLGRRAADFEDTDPDDPKAPQPARPEVVTPPDSVGQLIRSRAASGGLRRQLAEKYVERVTGLGDVELEPGHSSKTKDGLNNYVMVHHAGPRRTGAVAYLVPGSGLVHLRLPRDAANGREYAEAKTGKDDHAYQVKIRLVHEEALDEAVEMTALALALVVKGEW